VGRATTAGNVALTSAPSPPPFDAALTGRILSVLAATVLRYFRVRVLGTEHVPSGRGLVVGCHSIARWLAERAVA
jgi:hypothetical protein